MMSRIRYLGKPCQDNEECPNRWPDEDWIGCEDEKSLEERSSPELPVLS
jgi:hypothetical protein